MTRTAKRLRDTLAAIAGTDAPDPAAPAHRRAHVDQLRDLANSRNVVGIGIGEKRVGGEPTGELGICFYVRNKKPLNKIRGHQMVPPVVSVVSDRAIRTDVIEIGDLRLDFVNAKERPIQSGFSVGHFRDTAGTLGAVVRRDGHLHILSNAHVLALSGKARPGDPILYPGPSDGGTFPANAVAALVEAVPLVPGGSRVNRVDAAIAAIAPDRLDEIDPTIFGTNLPLRTTVPRRGMRVVKLGKASNTTTGMVIDVDFQCTLAYPHLGRPVGFSEQVLCTRYAEEGDSGSVVVDAQTGKVVGLHFASASGGSVFSPIAFAANALRFTF